jgi:hypothetical protein
MTSDYQEFLAIGSAEAPRGISEKVLVQVRRDLNPSPWAVFARLSAIHFFTALFTLSLCPQFGVRVLGSGMGLMHYFMGLGDTGCAIACGVLFIGTSVLLASLLLGPDQVRTIRKHRLLELGALTLLSLGVFVMMQAEIVLGFALAWLVGSFVGGIATLEVGWLIRRRLATV